jgi:serine/threonine protein kinase
VSRVQEAWLDRPPSWLRHPSGYTGRVKHGRIGRYELLHKIAAGGMAEIFLARQWGQGGFFRDVVIKRLFPHYAEHEHALRMFQDEARLLAELSHPNIPQVYDLGYADGYWYLAMEYVRGVSLADLCRAAAKANKPMPLAVAIGIAHQVCMALHHAHERRDREGRALRIVHRDVTPHNIMISIDAVVKVLDFGVAQTTARIDTDAGAVRGTYAYMGPEQVRGKPLDKRSDVFALGVILYELTTGRRLFRGNDVQVMTQIVERDVTPPSQMLSSYPPELEQIVLGALARERGKRTPSTAHLALALDQFCMATGLVIGPLVIAHYVHSLFPYERASEEGMGIAQVPSPGSQGMDLEQDKTLAAEQLEARLLAEELKAIEQHRSASVAARDTQRESPANPAALLPHDMFEVELEELSIDEMLLDEGEPSPHSRGSAVAAAGSPERLRIDEFDEDSEVKPVVLLSPKRKTPVLAPASDGTFMSDLERRLREDADS